MLSTIVGRGFLVACISVPTVAAWRPAPGAAERQGSAAPPAAVAPRPTRAVPLDTAVFAGGCFWGIEAVFEHVRGVTDAVSGYAGGGAKDAEYERVGTGTTGHAESVRVVYDPSKVSYDELLRVFFSVAHDPTQLNRQGPDVGTQYRSAIFYANDAQKRAATAYIEQLDRAKTFKRPIVTQVVPLRGFYPAEEYHQDFAARHPDHPYIVAQDHPKVERLRKQFPNLYRDGRG